jgi:hypothetical protein
MGKKTKWAEWRARSVYPAPDGPVAAVAEVVAEAASEEVAAPDTQRVGLAQDPWAYYFRYASAVVEAGVVDQGLGRYIPEEELGRTHQVDQEGMLALGGSHVAAVPAHTQPVGDYQTEVQTASVAEQVAVEVAAAGLKEEHAQGGALGQG